MSKRRKGNERFRRDNFSDERLGTDKQWLKKHRDKAKERDFLEQLDDFGLSLDSDFDEETN